MAKWKEPDSYEHLNLLLDQIGVRPKHTENTKTAPQSQDLPQEDPNDWYKQGKECPF